MLRQKNTYIIGALLALVLLAFKSEAQLIGGELSYSKTSDSLIVQLKTYEDLSKNLTISNYVWVSPVGSSSATYLSLSKVGSRDLSPSCNTACESNPEGYCESDYSVVERTYKASMALSQFNQDECDVEIRWSGCCRSYNGKGLQLQVSANICGETNVSPSFVSAPHPAIPVNQAFSYDHHALEPDGDSIAYELIPSYESQLTEVEYPKGLDEESPLFFLGYPKTSAPFPRGFHLGVHDGMLRFTPTKVQSSHIAIRAKEFRNGQFIGETVRDVMLRVEQMSNRPPVVTGINGSRKTKIKACYGQTLSFNIQTEDPDFTNQVIVDYSHNMTGAEVEVKSSMRSSIQFEWDAPKSAIGKTFKLYVIAKDDGCDVNNTYARLIEVEVIEPFSVQLVDNLSGCKRVHLNGVISDLDKTTSYEYKWEIEGKTYLGQTIEKSFAQSGDYKARLIVMDEESNCKSEAESIIQIPEGPVADAGENQSVCKDTKTEFNGSGGLKYNWFFEGQSEPVSNKRVASLHASENSNVILEVTDKYGCTDYDTVQLLIKKAEVATQAESSVICKGTEVTISALEGSEFEWQQDNLIEANGHQATYHLLENTEIVLYAKAENGCQARSLTTVEVDQDCVWPGDVNGDEKVNKHDLLQLGLAYGDNAVDVRDKKSIVWSPYISEDWPAMFPSTDRNIKHADANGDGFIDLEDVKAIDVNYSKEIIYNTNKKKGDEGAKLYFTYTKDSVKSGEEITVSVKLGTKDEPAKDVYGIAFAIQYNNTVKSNTISFSTKNSWLKGGSSKSNTIQIVKNLAEPGKNNGGKIDVGISRTNKQPVTGFGEIATLKFVVEDVIDAKKFEYILLNFLQIEVISSNGDLVKAYGEDFNLYIDGFDITSIDDKLNGISVYPNPAKEYLTVEFNDYANYRVQIIDLMGRVQLQTAFAQQATQTLNVAEFHGPHLLRIEDEQGNQRIIRIIFE